MRTVASPSAAVFNLVKFALSHEEEEEEDVCMGKFITRRFYSLNSHKCTSVGQTEDVSLAATEKRKCQCWITK